MAWTPIRLHWFLFMCSAYLDDRSYPHIICSSFCGMCSSISFWLTSKNTILAWCFCRGRTISQCGYESIPYIFFLQLTGNWFLNDWIIYIERDWFCLGCDHYAADYRNFRNWFLGIRIAVQYLNGPSVWVVSLLERHCQQSSIHHLSYLPVSEHDEMQLVVTPGPGLSNHNHHLFPYRSYTEKTGKMRPFIEAVRPLQPFGGMFIITTIWVLYSPNRICETEPRLLFLLFGTVFSNICVRHTR